MNVFGLPAGCPAPRRYPLAPLAQMAGMTDREALLAMKTSGSSYQKYRDEGMTRDIADRMAVRLGLHAYEVWPEMVEHDIAAMTRTCAAVGCEETFLVSLRNPSRHKYCSANCKSRMSNRAVYARNPEAKRAAVKAYDAQNRATKKKANQARYRLNMEAMRAYQREYYAAHRDEILAKRRGAYRRSSVEQLDARDAA